MAWVQTPQKPSAERRHFISQPGDTGLLAHPFVQGRVELRGCRAKNVRTPMVLRAFMMLTFPPKHVPLIQSFLLITLRENKVITKYVRFCQMLFKKPHKIVYEVTSDSYVKKIPPPFPNSFYSTPYPAHLPSNPTHEKFNFPFQKWCTSNSSLLCVSWFPL